MALKKSSTNQEVKIPVGAVSIEGLLYVPTNAKGIVLFAHGSGSGRFSPRNQYVAKVLQDENIATLLMDLLTPEEERRDLVSRELRFDIPFLTQRLLAVTDWVNSQKQTHALTIGYFGASTGAAAALIAAAEKGDLIRAVVSRGGRPDLAKQALPRVKAPTLLIVGAADFGVIELNEAAFRLLTCEKRLELVPNATHLFEEEGALEEVARLAKHWFENHL